MFVSKIYFVQKTRQLAGFLMSLCYNNAMESLASVLIFFFGAIIGSFLNVVIYRYNTGKTLGGRSVCFSCNKQLGWLELIPMVSFLAQRGKCRSCFSRISWQYPLVELVSGFLFLAAFWHFWPNAQTTVFYWVIFAILLVIAVYDIRHKIIPDGFVYTFIILSLVSSSLYPSYLLAGLVLFLFFVGLWYFSDGRWMGFGDAKLAVGIGLLLGFEDGISAVITAFWLGALVGLSLVLYGRLSRLSRRGKYLTIKSEIPFAPFLIAGVILNLLWGFNVFFF